MEGLKWSHFYRRSIQDCSFQSHHLLTFKYSSYLTHMVHIKSVLTAFLLKGVSTVKAQNIFHSICGLNSNGPNNPVSVIASGCPSLEEDFKQKFSDCHDDSGKCSAQFQKLLPELLDKVFISVQMRTPIDEFLHMWKACWLCMKHQHIMSKTENIFNWCLIFWKKISRNSTRTLYKNHQTWIWLTESMALTKSSIALYSLHMLHL